MMAMAMVASPDPKITVAIIAIVLGCAIISALFFLAFRGAGLSPVDVGEIINDGTDALTDCDGDGSISSNGGCLWAAIIAALMALAFFSVSVIIYFANAAYKALGG